MDVRRFKAVFLPCSRAMYWAAFRLTGNSAEAEDLMQDAFLKLWTGRDKLPAMESAEGYAVKTLHRLFLDRQRTLHPETDTAIDNLVNLPADDNLQHEVELREQNDYVIKLIEKLPAQQRQIITLRDIDGLSYDEICRKTGLSQINVRVILSRARKAIRKKFDRNKTTR
ncbi:MAG: RNA polymerase sigma factor [Prevotella sp.]|nr:RNA polymerase sigma factor [Prevotella sp.]